VVTQEWDNDSVIKLLDRPQDSAVLIEQMENGIYDAVQERISENIRTDVTGAYRNRSNYDQYMLANQQLEAEYQDYLRQEQARQQAAAQNGRSAAAEGVVSNVTEQPAVEREPIAEAKDAKQYREKVQASEAEAAKARAKATRVSKPKGKAKKKEAVNPVTLGSQDFQKYFDDLLKL
jgi:hypothetical protein